MKMRILTLAAVVALVGACKGDRGPAGPPGPPGTPGDTTDGGGGGNDGGGTDGGGTDGGGTDGGVAIPAGGGLKYQIQSATVATGAAPTVTFKVTDAAGNPITNLKTSDTALAWTPNFTIAKRDATTGTWTSYLTRQVTGKPWIDSAGTTHQPAATAAVTQAASEAATAARISGGSGGVYTYTFAGPVATGLDTAATTRIGVYGNRTTADGAAYPASNTFDFVPAGGTPTANPDLVADAQCEVCHGVVRAHGDQRLGVKLCITCHTPQTIDPETNNSVDFPVMVHKIHTGKAVSNSQGTGSGANGAATTPHPMLGAKGYTIVGFAPNNPATFPASAAHEYGLHAAMGPSHTTYFELNGPATGVPISDPGITRNCAICHGAQNAATVQSDAAMTLQACTQCHGTIDPTTGAGHPLFSPTTGCAACHNATGIQPVTRGHSEFWEAAHDLDLTPTGLPAGQTRHVLAIKIDDVRDAVVGKSPVVDFTITLDGQPYDVLTKGLGSLGFQMAGPVAINGQPADIVEVLPTTGGPSPAATSPGVVSALLTAPAGSTSPQPADPAKVTARSAAAGQFTFTFPAANAIPAGRTGTYAFSYEAYYREQKAAANADQVSKPYAAQTIWHGANRNIVYREIQPATYTGPGNVAGTERRVVTSIERCNACHELIGFHGDRARLGPDYCATCHNANLANTGRFRFLRSAGEGGNSVLAPSVAANVFIHKIHMGAELTTPEVLGSNRTATSAGPGAEGFSDFTFFDSPSPNVKCTTCHEGQTYGLPTTVNQPPIRMTRFTCGPNTANDATVAAGGPAPAGVYCGDRVPTAVWVPHNKAVCSSCHDSPQAMAHMDINTVYPTGQSAASYDPYAGGTGGAINPANTAIETCATCHGAGSEADPLKVHQAPTFLAGSR